jgi:hypothetical protein
MTSRPAYLESFRERYTKSLPFNHFGAGHEMYEGAERDKQHYKRRMNTEPHAIGHLANAEGTLVMLDSDPVLAGVVPFSTHIPHSGTDNIHGMIIWGNQEGFFDLHTARREQLAPAIAMSRKFLTYATGEQPDRFACVGCHQGLEIGGGSARTQRFEHWHMLAFHRDTLSPSQPEQHRYDNYPDNKAATLKKLQRIHSEQAGAGFASLLNEAQQEAFLGGFPEGGIVYALPPEADNGTIADFMQGLDASYRRLHEEMMSAAFEHTEGLYTATCDEEVEAVRLTPRNLDTVDWSSLPTLSQIPQEEARELLADFQACYAQHQQQWENAAPDERKLRAFRKSPCYAMAFHQDKNGQLYLMFEPSITQSHGYGMAIGIQPRTVEREGTQPDTLYQNTMRAMCAISNVPELNRDIISRLDWKDRIRLEQAQAEVARAAAPSAIR